MSAGLLGIADKDPWDHYLRIEFTNRTDKTISAVKFGVVFVNSLAETERSVYAYTSDANVKPGKTSKPYWGDGVYFNQFGYKMSAGAFVERIMFTDGSLFEGGADNPCVFPQGPYHPAVPTSDISKIRDNSLSAVSSPASANAAAAMGHVVTPQEAAQLVKQRKASVVAVITAPAGADVYVDGNKVGVSPLVFNVLRLPDKEQRTISVKLAGYKEFDKTIIPDGSRVPIGISLEKQ
ncbi:MAG TPA: PEGA domain-containing protein [Terriglobales bacterium]|nr:PEGA domain-containing protein [Terriglobales bacterium]